MVRAEERTSLLRELVWEGLGTDDVENFMNGQKILRFENNRGEGDGRDRDNVSNCMINKLEDSVRDEEVMKRTVTLMSGMLMRSKELRKLLN